jgi:hypothetical protein
MRSVSWKRGMKYLLGGGALLLLSVGMLGQEPSAPVRVVKYADLATEVLQLRGKIVVVDVWHAN